MSWIPRSNARPKVTGKAVSIVPYDSRRPELVQEEEEHLLACLPLDLIRRIADPEEHEPMKA